MIQLTFVNRALDINRPDIVFFHRDEASSRDKVLAWKVIHHCGVDWHHPFRVPSDFELGLVDAFGNESPKISIRNGQKYTLVRRRRLPEWRVDHSEHCNAIEVVNRLDGDLICYRLTRAGSPVVPERWLAPAQESRISLRPERLWVGAMVGVREGQLLGRFEVETALTCLDLRDIHRGEVLMLGGGIGVTATAYRFHLRDLRA